MITKMPLGLCAIAATAVAQDALAPVARAASDAPAPICLEVALDEVHIPGFVEAKVAGKPKPRYPKQALDHWSEGWLLLEFAITAEGRVRDLAVVDAMGPKDFVKETLRVVENWTYEPATRNGQPVDQHLHQTSVLYLIEGSGRNAHHGFFVRKFNQARAYLRDDDYDNAIAMLEQAFAKRLNLYEEAMGSFLFAVAYTNKGDWARALYHARHAVIEDGTYLEDSLKAPAFSLLVELETREGSYDGALCAFEKLRKLDPPSAADGTAAAKNAARIEAALKSTAPMATPVRLTQHPLFDSPAAWRHRLLRSKFSFAEVKGDVRSFRLACFGTVHEAPVDMDTRWDVPKAAGPCILRVDGAPGATFTLVEEH